MYHTLALGISWNFTFEVPRTAVGRLHSKRARHCSNSKICSRIRMNWSRLAYPELNQTLLPSCCYKSPGTFCWTSPATSITKTIHFLVNIYISKSQKGFFFVKSHHPLHPSPHPLHPSQLLNRLLAFPIFGDRRPFHPSRLGCQERPRWRSGGEVLRPSDWETSGPCWVCVFFWLANPLFGKWFDWWRSPHKNGVFKKVDGGLIFKSFKGATHVTKAYPAVTPEGVL